MKKETLEEAAEKYSDRTEEYVLKCRISKESISHLGLYLGFIEGAKWNQERMYSEADMREAYFTAIRSTGEGWNGEHAGNSHSSIEKTFSEGYEIFIEQYKKK